MLGHLASPTVRFGLLLEHGCEKTHNDYFRNRLTEAGLDPDRFGWASVQLDGGIDSVVAKVEDWFAEIWRMRESWNTRALARKPCGWVCTPLVHFGRSCPEPRPDNARRRELGRDGGRPERAAVLSSPVYLEAVLGDRPVENTLAYGQAVPSGKPGLHVMEAPTDHWVETATGLRSDRVEVMLAHVVGHPLQAHRMIPLVQASDPRRWRDMQKTST